MKAKIKDDIYYEIIEVDNQKDFPEQPSKDMLYYGQAVHYLQQIYLWSALPLSQKRQTLKHELAHAFIQHHALSNLENYSEETLCDFVGSFGEEIITICNEYFKEVK